MSRVRLIQGDNRAEMRTLLDAGERFALAYLDPPFFTQRDYETAEGDAAFSDKWDSLEEYLDALEKRVRLARDLLLPEGSLVLHLDSTAVHYAKVRCDGIFGRECFAGEIVWRYRRWPAQCRNFQAMHDVLLRYVATDDGAHRWNQLFEPLSLKTQEAFKGAKQKAKTAGGRRLKSVGTAEASPGAPLSDVWELPIVGPSSPERTGFPTQKPEALYARLVDALTNEGDTVLDPYCGSGTMLAVCAKRGRRCVGIDRSPAAIAKATARVEPILAQRSLFG